MARQPRSAEFTTLMVGSTSSNTVQSAYSPKISSSSYNISYILSAFALDKIKKSHLSDDICRDLCSLATCHGVAEQDLGHVVIEPSRNGSAEKRFDTGRNH
ncbi:hypothetical protein OCU04_012965 [Sclerotinia nivalis]|uniref:Uncharacterized protein n=1 Tax=Sclerotinia nivalis TaxID=352851 RepID=A0A9X0A8R7_9HELO|nr:hypothetical protein OCU04_012965 [Sclerotinia nivalis]